MMIMMIMIMMVVMMLVGTPLKPDLQHGNYANGARSPCCKSGFRVVPTIIITTIIIIAISSSFGWIMNTPRAPWGSLGPQWAQGGSKGPPMGPRGSYGRVQGPPWDPMGIRWDPA